jgi:hypothetical protein
LQAQGNSAAPIIFTSIKDDSIGGDTNGDGTKTSAAAGDWNQIAVNGTNATANLSFAELRYAGGSFVSNSGAFEVDRGQTTLANVTISNVRSAGLRFGAVTSTPFELTNVRIADAGADGVRVDGPSAVDSTNLTIQNVGRVAVNLFDAGKWSSRGTSLSGTGLAAIEFNGGTINDTRAWDDSAVYDVSNVVTVAKGASLTIPGGAVVKFDSSGGLSVQGTLNVLGVSASPTACRGGVAAAAAGERGPWALGLFGKNAGESGAV